MRRANDEKTTMEFCFSLSISRLQRGIYNTGYEYLFTN
jgi:hypothetical protein